MPLSKLITVNATKHSNLDTNTSMETVTVMCSKHISRNNINEVESVYPF